MDLRFYKAFCLLPISALIILPSCIHTEQDKPNGTFVLKGRLIDQCTKQPLQNSYWIAVSYDGNDRHSNIGNSYSDQNGNFEIECKLYTPGEGYYYMATVPGTIEQVDGIKPKKSGDIVDLGDIVAGYSLYVNLKFIISDPKTTDSLFLGNNASRADTVIYPIPASGIVNYSYYRYNVDFAGPQAKSLSTHFGIGKTAYENTINKNVNQVIANEVACSSVDTTTVNVN